MFLYHMCLELLLLHVVGINSEIPRCFVIAQLKSDTIFADSDPVDCTTETHSLSLAILFLTVLASI